MCDVKTPSFTASMLLRVLRGSPTRVPKNFWTVVLEKTLESPLDRKEIHPVHSEEDQPWDFFGRNDAKAETPLATSYEEVTHWKRLWCWEGLGAGGEGDDRGWDGWMASPTRWTWVWVNSGSWWWTGRLGVLWFMGLQSVGYDWVTQLNWKLLVCAFRYLAFIFISYISVTPDNGFPVLALLTFWAK